MKISLIKRKKEFNHILKGCRGKLKKLYADNISEQKLERGKRETLEQLKIEYSQLKREWNGYAGYDQWMEQDINNAHLAIVATYNELVPLFSKKMNESDNITDFYKYMTELSEKSLAQRKKILNY